MRRLIDVLWRYTYRPIMHHAPRLARLIDAPVCALFDWLIEHTEA